MRETTRFSGAQLDEDIGGQGSLCLALCDGSCQQNVFHLPGEKIIYFLWTQTLVGVQMPLKCRVQTRGTRCWTQWWDSPGTKYPSLSDGESWLLAGTSKGHVPDLRTLVFLEGRLATPVDVLWSHYFSFFPILEICKSLYSSILTDR